MRPDIFVLVRFCDYLDCDITDIIEYKKNRSEKLLFFCYKIKFCRIYATK